MAWYNPSTWTVVDNLQGQNHSSAGGASWAGNVVGKAASAAQAAMPKPKASAFSNDIKSQYDELEALKRSLASISSPPIPRFVSYDTAASWQKAREQATKAVSPIYKQQLDDYIKNTYNLNIARGREDTTTGKSALDQALERLLGDTGVQRTRTEEDTATNIKDLTEGQDFMARQEGLNFDAANRALTEGLGAAGLAESGLGQQQVDESQMQRRDMSNEQVRQTDNKIEAATTLMNRTFEDLTTKETRSTEDTTSSKAKLDLDLERLIADEKIALNRTKKDLELKKQADIASKSINIQGQLVDKWIASLAGQGYTNQEIANAAAIYR